MELCLVSTPCVVTSPPNADQVEVMASVERLDLVTPLHNERLSRDILTIDAYVLTSRGGQFNEPL